jgi:hypothetical protein
VLDPQAHPSRLKSTHYANLYKTDSPEAIHSPNIPEDFHPGEYRQLVISQSPDDPSERWTLTQRQGWYYEDEKRAMAPVTQLKQSFATYPEVDEAYRRQLQSIKASGFIYSHTPNYNGQRGSADYEILTP